MSLELVYSKDVTDDLDIQDRQHEISRMLHSHNCEVTFTKVDGTVRVMPCTLQVSALPERDASKLTESKKHNPNTLSVWCLDKKEWRSFRVANVLNVKVLND